MITLILQVLVSVLALAFGLGALRAGRSSPAVWGARRASLLLAGSAFTISGVNGIVAKSIAVWAFVAGDGSTAMQLWMHVRTIGNDGRTLMMFGFALMLWRIPAGKQRDEESSATEYVPPLLLWMVAGSALGLLEGPAGSTHYGLLSVVNAATVLALLTALWRAVARDSMDYLLWIALTVYAVREVIGTSLTSVFAWLNVPGAWTPSLSSLQWVAVGSYLVMLACLARCLDLTRRGVTVPSLFELDGRKTNRARARQLGAQRASTWTVE